MSKGKSLKECLDDFNILYQTKISIDQPKNPEVNCPYFKFHNLVNFDKDSSRSLKNKFREILIQEFNDVIKEFKVIIKRNFNSL